MSAYFQTFGPFRVGKIGAPLEARELKAFWDDIEEVERSPLSTAIGVYVLVVGKGRAQKPLYVGRAEHGFRARLKPNHDAFRKLQHTHKGMELSLLLLARVSGIKGNFIRTRHKDESLKSIRDLEILLLRDFMRSGAELMNSKEKTFFEGLVVPGYLHDHKSQRTNGAIALSKMLGEKGI